MKKTRSYSVSVLLAWGAQIMVLLSAPQPVLARIGAPVAWEGGMEIGFISSSGNTDTSALNTRVKAVLNAGAKSKNELAFEALYSEDSGKTTSERYDLSLKSAYLLTRVDYVFARVRYEKDRFAGFDYRVAESVGYGRYLVQRDALTLQVEGGPGGSHREFLDGKREDEWIINMTGKLSWEIREKTVFTHTVTSDIGEDGTVTESVTALQAHLGGSSSMKTTYSLRHDSNPPPGASGTDARTSVTLVYDFY
jgi:putative salt-induced outer membrane protein